MRIALPLWNTSAGCWARLWADTPCHLSALSIPQSQLRLMGALRNDYSHTVADSGWQMASRVNFLADVIRPPVSARCSLYRST